MPRAWLRAAIAACTVSAAIAVAAPPAGTPPTDAPLACPAQGHADAAPAVQRIAPLDVPRSEVVEASLPAAKRTAAGLYLTAVEAGIMVEAAPERLLFVDVRTRGELLFVGVPVGIDANVPFLLDPAPAQWDDEKGTLKLARNPDFVAAIDRLLARKGLGRDAMVMLICQGGVRAAMAANALAGAGFARVYSVVDGFEGDPAADGPQKGLRVVNGWRNAGLPWTAKLDRAKLDLPD